MSKTILTEVDGWTPVIDAVVQDVGIMTAAVFGRVWRYCQMKDGVCQAGVERMADELSIERKTFMRHLEILTEKGYLEDHSPDLRNRPHTYSDTGKAGLIMTISAVPKTDTTTSGVPKRDSAVPINPTDCVNLVHEDSIKKENKIEVVDINNTKEKPPLIKEPITTATEKLRARGVSGTTLLDIIKTVKPEKIISYCDWYDKEAKDGKVHNGGWLVTAIREKWWIPGNAKPQERNYLEGKYADFIEH